jgi:exodeoxyribonuclease VII small subunit
MSNKSDADKQTPPDFEEALQELERLVEQLESGELSLAASLEHFEQGVRLSRQCHALLDQARQSVELLMQPEQEDSAEPFDLTDAGRSPPAETSD